MRQQRQKKRRRREKGMLWRRNTHTLAYAFKHREYKEKLGEMVNRFGSFFLCGGSDEETEKGFF